MANYIYSPQAANDSGGSEYDSAIGTRTFEAKLMSSANAVKATLVASAATTSGVGMSSSGYTGALSTDHWRFILTVNSALGRGPAVVTWDAPALGTAGDIPAGTVTPSFSYNLADDGEGWYWVHAHLATVDAPVTAAASPPATPTTGTITIDPWGGISIPWASTGADGAKVYRGTQADGSDRAEITTRCAGVTGASGTAFDYSPRYGTPHIPFGATAYYWLKGTNGGGDSAFSSVVSITHALDKDAVIADAIARQTSTHAALSGGVDTRTSSPTPIMLAEAYRRTMSSTELARVQAQWDHISDPSRTDAGGWFKPFATPNFDETMRTPWYVFQCSRIMRLAGQTALADEMLAAVEGWALAGFLRSYGGTASFTNSVTGKVATLNRHVSASNITLDGSMANNQEAFGMSLIAMLCSDAASSFSLDMELTAGVTADAALKNTVNHCWWAQKRNGVMPWGDQDGANAGTPGTVNTGDNSNYHTASMLSLYEIQRACGEGWYPRLDDMLANGYTHNSVTWDSATTALDLWETEPNLFYYQGAFTGSGGEEIPKRALLHRHLGGTDDLLDIEYTHAFHHTDGTWRGYSMSEPWKGGSLASYPEMQYANWTLFGLGVETLLTTLPTDFDADAAGTGSGSASLAFVVPFTPGAVSAAVASATAAFLAAYSAGGAGSAQADAAFAALIASVVDAHGSAVTTAMLTAVLDIAATSLGVGSAQALLDGADPVVVEFAASAIAAASATAQMSELMPFSVMAVAHAVASAAAQVVVTFVRDARGTGTAHAYSGVLEVYREHLTDGVLEVTQQADGSQSFVYLPDGASTLGN